MKLAAKTPIIYGIISENVVVMRRLNICTKSKKIARCCGYVVLKLAFVVVAIAL